jgi:hypothetical protein
MRSFREATSDAMAPIIPIFVIVKPPVLFRTGETPSVNCKGCGLLCSALKKDLRRTASDKTVAKEQRKVKDVFQRTIKDETVTKKMTTG